MKYKWRIAKSGKPHVLFRSGDDGKTLSLCYLANNRGWLRRELRPIFRLFTNYNPDKQEIKQDRYDFSTFEEAVRFARSLLNNI